MKQPSPGICAGHHNFSRRLLRREKLMAAAVPTEGDNGLAFLTVTAVGLGCLGVALAASQGFSLGIS